MFDRVISLCVFSLSFFCLFRHSRNCFCTCIALPHKNQSLYQSVFLAFIVAAAPQLLLYKDFATKMYLDTQTMYKSSLFFVFFVFIFFGTAATTFVRSLCAATKK